MKIFSNINNPKNKKLGLHENYFYNSNDNKS